MELFVLAVLVGLIWAAVMQSEKRSIRPSTKRKATRCLGGFFDRIQLFQRASSTIRIWTIPFVIIRPWTTRTTAARTGGKSTTWASGTPPTGTC